MILLYLGKPASDALEPAGAAQLAPGHVAAPAQTTIGGELWPFAQALGTESAVLVQELPAAFGPLPGGPWDAPATSAMVVPLRARGEFAPLGYMVAGLSPRLRLDDDYRDFLQRIAGQVADQVAAARAYTAANAAVQLRDDFLSVAAHELKNPLTPLIGRLQLLERRLRRDGADEQHIQAASRAAGDARRLVEQIDMLLDVSRMRSGQLSLTRARFDLAALAQQTVDEIAPTLELHTLDMATPGVVALVEADMQRMEQVLRNLLGNAVKYSPQGGAITVSIAVAEGLVRVAVRDQGIGIPEEARSQLFTRYYRASNAEEQLSGGLGIGLFVVQEIVRLHGGRVELQSALGAGSTFTVVLPLADSVPYDQELAL